MSLGEFTLCLPFYVLGTSLFTHSFHFCRKWYISIVPPGCNPGTTEGVDFYAAAANVNNDYRDTLPPGAGWMTFGEEAGSPPSRVYRSRTQQTRERYTTGTATENNGDNNAAVTLQIRDDSGEVTQFKVRGSIQMSKVFITYASKMGVDASSLQFSLNGVNIQGSDTPLSLDLNDDDLIDVVNIDIDSDSDGEELIEDRSSHSLSCYVPSEHEEAGESRSQTICTPQSEISQNQNPESMLSAFDRLTQEQKNTAIASAGKRTDDPLKEWTPPSRDECPICLIPLPIDDKSTSYRPCCGKIICKGCVADQIHMLMRDSGDELQEEMIKALNQCMFCRTDMYGKSDELNKAAAENNRPEGMFRVGQLYLEPGLLGTVRQEHKQEGMKWLKRATVLGCGKAAEKIGDIHLEDENERDAYFYFTKAAELGRVQSFVKLGNIELDRGNVTTAMNNYRKATICGVKSEGLVQVLKRGFMEKYITRDEYFSTLYRNYKANEEMNSESRKRALHKW